MNQRAMKQWIAIFLSICIFQLEGLSSNTSNDYVKKGDSLLMLGMLQDASLAYESAIFYASDADAHCEAIIKKSTALIIAKSYESAYKQSQRAYFNELSDSNKLAIKMVAASAAYLMADFALAEVELLSLQMAQIDNELMSQSHYLKALIYNEQTKWEDAMEEWKRAIESKSMTAIAKDSLKSVIAIHYAEENIPKLKDPEKASKLSAFLPGVGHIYAGYFWEGAANVLMQLTGLAVGGVAVYFKYYVTGVIIGYGMFQRFYSGGVNRAEFLAKRKNHQRIRSFNDDIRTKLAVLNNL